MTNAQVLNVVVVAIPQPTHIRDIDLDSEKDAIRFTWRNVRFRVTHNFGVSEVVGNVLMHGSELSILLGALLRTQVVPVLHPSMPALAGRN